MSVRMWRAGRRWRSIAVALAGLSALQAPGCYPDLLGALNFELQSLVNTVLITAADTIIQNVLGL